MNIYSQNLATESTLEDLIAGFNTGQAYGNTAANLNCVRLAKIANLLLQKHNGKRKSSKYQSEYSQICDDLKIEKFTFARDVKVGEYLMTTNDPDLYQLPKSQIEARFKTPKESKPKKPSATELLKQEIAELKQRATELEQNYEKRIAELEKNAQEAEVRIANLEAAEEALLFVRGYYDDRDQPGSFDSWLRDNGIRWTINNPLRKPQR